MGDEPKLGQSRGNAGKGRRKGSTNKVTKALKDMILTALDQAHPEGGIEYLKAQSAANPVAFMALVGRVLPLTLGGDPNAPIVHKVIREFVSAPHPNG